MAYFKKWTVIIALILVLLVITMAVSNYFEREIFFLRWLEERVYYFTTPLVAGFAVTYNYLNSYINTLLSVPEIINENKRLAREVGLLNKEIHQLESLIKQNKRLEKLVDFLDVFQQEYRDYEVVGAAVIGYGPGNWQDKLIINKGTKAGIKPRMPVISYYGVLVGRISQVSSNTAQVLSVNSPDFAVSGISERSRVIGLVQGQAAVADLNVMEKIDAEADIKENDRILTSGLSEYYPRYLPIGRVVNVAIDDYGLTQKAEIELFYSRYTVEEVLVITEF